MPKKNKAAPKLPGSIFTLNKVNLYEYGFLRHPQLVDSTTENRFEVKLWIVVDNVIHLLHRLK